MSSSGGSGVKSAAGGSSSSSSGGGSAWSRPLNNRGRFSNVSSSGIGIASSNKSSGGGGGQQQQQRPPPGMEGDGGGTRFGAWGNRGGGSGGNFANNGNSKKSANNNNNNISNINTANSAELSNSQQQEQIILRERFLHLTLSMVGHTVTLTTTDNQIIEGVFHTFTPFDSLNDEEMKNKYVIKACRIIQLSNGAMNNEDKQEAIVFEEGGTLVIPSDRVASVQVKSMRLDNTNVMNNGSAASFEKTSIGEGGGDSGADTSTFQTDSQISGGRGGNHNLVAAGSVWTSAGDGSDLSLGSNTAASTPYRSSTPSSGGKKGADSLNWRAAAARGGTSFLPSTKSGPSTGSGVGGVSGALDGSIGDWDQFSANELKFNVKASFDENLYTTKLDVSNIDTAKIAEAERIAREIEGTASSNIHIAEERNQTIQTDYDEEDLYSGVLTKDLKARKIKVVSDVPSTTAAATTTTTTSTTNTSHAKEEEEKKGAKTAGKVMNYAQAAAKKGLTERTAKPPAAPATATTSASTSKNAEKSTPSEGRDSATILPAQPEKKVESEVSAEKPSGAETKAKASDNDIRYKEGEATKDVKGEKDATFKPKLNPNAKSFTFNPTAKSFTPSFAAPATSVSSMPALQPLPAHSMDTQMMMPLHPHPHGEYPGGPPMMGMGMGSPQFAPMHGELH